ncbi:hypothetical protein BS50DRAFT_207387 [Corynespora cassiicola Philippines]|uniref:Uncharacterized protein n=1 Tax=Corynespora cassiicola Philippines TaxID=1448308 RepID=A0A2T2N4J0_CORCC|nr:hypothetical protein BS50DRAFT_207387 [Corynespora cassiicola Philippines]
MNTGLLSNVVLPYHCFDSSHPPSTQLAIHHAQPDSDYSSFSPSGPRVRSSPSRLDSASPSHPIPSHPISSHLSPPTKPKARKAAERDPWPGFGSGFGSGSCACTCMRMPLFLPTYLPTYLPTHLYAVHIHTAKPSQATWYAIA